MAALEHVLDSDTRVLIGLSILETVSVGKTVPRAGDSWHPMVCITIRLLQAEMLQRMQAITPGLKGWRMYNTV